MQNIGDILYLIAVCDETIWHSWKGFSQKNEKEQ